MRLPSLQTTHFYPEIIHCRTSSQISQCMNFFKMTLQFNNEYIWLMSKQLVNHCLLVYFINLWSQWTHWALFWRSKALGLKRIAQLHSAVSKSTFAILTAENDNCVGLKMAKRLALRFAPLFATRKIGPSIYFSDRYKISVSSALETNVSRALKTDILSVQIRYWDNSSLPSWKPAGSVWQNSVFIGFLHSHFSARLYESKSLM